MAAVRTAAQAVASSEDLAVLLGIEPEAPDPEYGWIVPGAIDAGRTDPLLSIAAFREKPDPATALQLYRLGALWNTLVLITRARTLLEMYEAHLPELSRRFRRIRATLGTSHEATVLEEEYAAMPSISISHGLLQTVPANLRVLQVSGVLWSDWGNPTRICRTLARIGGLHELTSKLARRGYDPEAVLRQVGWPSCTPTASF
jgi:mannose-1-phosphate guanylyltransferase